MTSTRPDLELKDDARELLVMQIPNEILNGFKLNDFEGRVGISEPEFRTLAKALRSETRVVVNGEQALALRNALSEVMDELTTEFQTRTGYYLSEASTVLRQLDDFIESQGVR